MMQGRWYSVNFEGIKEGDFIRMEHDSGRYIVVKIGLKDHYDGEPCIAAINMVVNLPYTSSLIDSEDFEKLEIA